jgi:hypothetical protein
MLPLPPEEFVSEGGSCSDPSQGGESVQGYIPLPII